MGGRTVAELLRRMSSREFTAWQAFARNYGLPDVRGDLQAGIVANAIRNADGKQGFPLNDYILDIKPRRKESPDQLVRRAAAGLGLGLHKRKR